MRSSLLGLGLLLGALSLVGTSVEESHAFTSSSRAEPFFLRRRVVYAPCVESPSAAVTQKTTVRPRSIPRLLRECTCPQLGDLRPPNLHAVGNCDPTDDLVGWAISLANPDSVFVGELVNGPPDWLMSWDNAPIDEGATLLDVEMSDGSIVIVQVEFTVQQGAVNCDEEGFVMRRTVAKARAKPAREKAQIKVKEPDGSKPLPAGKKITAKGTIDQGGQPVYGVLIDRNHKPAKVTAGKTINQGSNWTIEFKNPPTGKNLLLRVKSINGGMHQVKIDVQ